MLQRFILLWLVLSSAIAYAWPDITDLRDPPILRFSSLFFAVFPDRLMSGNSFGQFFRITTAGESHGPGNVVIVDGVPPGLPLTAEDLMGDLERRRPGQSRLTTQRKEADLPEILSGVFEGVTTGTSIAILIRNTDQRSRDYSDIQDKYRPGHADYTYDARYGFRDYRGGGRSSARETTARVAAGVIAKKLIAQAFGGIVTGYVCQVGPIKASVPAPEAVTQEQVEQLPDGSPNIVRCPDYDAGQKMIDLIDEVRKDTDSIGGVSEIVVTGVPAGLGAPVFDKIKAELADLKHGLCAIPNNRGRDRDSSPNGRIFSFQISQRSLDAHVGQA